MPPLDPLLANSYPPTLLQEIPRSDGGIPTLPPQFSHISYRERLEESTVVLFFKADFRETKLSDLGEIREKEEEPLPAHSRETNAE